RANRHNVLIHEAGIELRFDPAFLFDARDGRVVLGPGSIARSTMLHRSSSFLALVAAMAGRFTVTSPARALVLCAKRSGAAMLRSEWKPKEGRVDFGNTAGGLPRTYARSVPTRTPSAHLRSILS